MSNELLRAVVSTPIGPLTLLARKEAPRALCALIFGDGRAAETWVRRNHPGASITDDAKLNGMVAEFEAYLGGDLKALDRIETETTGTPFQKKVWRELRRIPAGRTISYSELARRIRQPPAVRAVASANARNPVAIVVPCHRVIAADGKLGGYGGGLERKRWLLRHEAKSAKTGRGPQELL